MSEYQQFLHERDQIDYLYQKGYVIKKITEDLYGAIVEFVHNENDNDIETLQVSTADARKYFSLKLIQQKKNQLSS